MREEFPYRFPVLLIRDKANGEVHAYGTDTHDSLFVDDKGNLNYYNLQNGDGTGEDGGYEFVYEPDEGGYNGIKEVYSDWTNQQKDYNEMSREQLVYQCLMKDLRIRLLLKVGDPHQA